MQGFPLSHQFLDIHVRIEHRRITVSLANHLASGPQKPFRRTGTDMNGTSRLQDMQFLNRFKHDIGNFAYPVAAVGFHSSDIQVGKVVVGSAFLGGNTDLRRCRMVIYLDKEAGHQLFGFITGKGPRSYFFFIERSQMLVEMSRVHGIPAVQFGNGSQMDKPIHLDSFPIRTGSMGRNPTANFSYLTKFGSPHRVFLRHRHFIRQVGMTFGKENGGIAGDRHGGKFLLFIRRFRVIHEIEVCQFAGNPFFQVQQTVAVDFSVKSRMSRSTLFHKFGKHTDFISLFPFFRDMAENTFTLCTAFPVWDYFAFISIYIFLADGITLQFTGIQHMQVFHTMAGQFGKSRNGFRCRTTFTHNQFVFTYIDGLLPAYLKKVQCSQDWNRIFPVILLVEAGFDKRPFDRQGRFSLKRKLA